MTAAVAGLRKSNSFYDAARLAGIPWRLSFAEESARYGVGTPSTNELPRPSARSPKPLQLTNLRSSSRSVSSLWPMHMWDNSQSSSPS